MDTTDASKLLASLTNLPGGGGFAPDRELFLLTAVIGNTELSIIAIVEFQMSS